MEQRITQPEVTDTRTRRKRKKRKDVEKGNFFFILKSPVHGCEGRRPASDASDWLLQTEDLILDCRWTATHPKFNSSVWRAQTYAPRYDALRRIGPWDPLEVPEVV